MGKKKKKFKKLLKRMAKAYARKHTKSLFLENLIESWNKYDEISKLELENRNGK